MEQSSKGHQISSSYAPVTDSIQTLHPLSEYFAIGFDIDHCLVRNKTKEIFPHLCNCLYKVLVEERGYPQSLYNFGTIEKNFLLNGLVIDLKTGNILKLGEGKVVLRAYFGFTRLSQEKMERTYGKPPTFEVFDVYKDFTAEYSCYLTFFNCYFPLVFAKMVEYKRQDRNSLNAKEIKEIMDDANYAINFNYKNCNKDEYISIAEFGYYYKEVLNNLPKYLYKHDEMLAGLKTLKAKGKVLFLVSDSHYEYVEILMDYGYGPEWRELFDYILVNAKKKRFFSCDKNLFQEIDLTKANRLGAETEQLIKKKMYAGGNAHLLDKNLRTSRQDGTEKRILYMGDNYLHDVLAAKSLDKWDAVCIMEELGELDLGEEYDGSVWGPWNYEETLYGVIQTLWYSEMMKKANKCTEMVYSKEMIEFYNQEESEAKMRESEM